MKDLNDNIDYKKYFIIVLLLLGIVIKLFYIYGFVTFKFYNLMFWFIFLSIFTFRLMNFIVELYYENKSLKKQVENLKKRVD